MRLPRGASADTETSSVRGAACAGINRSDRLMCARRCDEGAHLIWFEYRVAICVGPSIHLGEERAAVAVGKKRKVAVSKRGQAGRRPTRLRLELRGLVT